MTRRKYEDYYEALQKLKDKMEKPPKGAKPVSPALPEPKDRLSTEEPSNEERLLFGV